MKSISDRSAPVLVVHQNQALRLAMRTTVQKLGFGIAKTGSEITDAYKFLNENSVGWMIMPAFSNQKDNSLGVLKKIIDEASLAGIRITFLADHEDRVILPEAFELGLLSWISLPLNPSAFQQETRKVLELAQACQNDSMLVAAEYLRVYLTEVKDFKSILRLENSILKLLPEEPAALYSLGKAHLNLKNVNQAKSYLRQAVFIKPEIQADINAYLRELGKETEAVKVGLGFNHIMIIDSDHDAVASIAKALKEDYPDAEVFTCPDGLEAWMQIEADKVPDLIVMEWRLRELGACALIQRIRNRGIQIPIVIASSLLKDKDKAIVSEMFVAEVVPKPIQLRTLKAVVGKVQLQEVFPSELKALEKNIISALANKDLAHARQLKQKILQLESLPSGFIEYIDAEFLFAVNRFEDAQAKCAQSIRKAGKESLSALNLLGKCLMSMNKLEDALKCFEKAQALSPQNVQRICQIADTQADLGNTDAALETLDAAKALDKNAEVVQTSTIKAAMSSGDTKQAQRIMQDLGNAKEFVAQMNNRAVIFIRANDFENGEKIYKETLASVPEGEKELKARVLYNLGLCYAKQNKLEEAAKYMDQASRGGSKAMQNKTGSLGKRIKASIAKGTLLKIRPAESEMPMPSEMAEEILSEINDDSFVSDDNKVIALPERTGICLFKVYKRSA